jgi:hypothetical protein
MFNIMYVQNLYVLCDIGITIAKNLGHKKNSSGRIPGGTPLPSQFYKVCEGNEEEKVCCELDHLDFIVMPREVNYANHVS